MRTKYELDVIKGFIDSTYNNLGNKLIIDDGKPLNIENPEFGYCYKDIIPDRDRELYYYYIVCSKMGIPRSDYRIMMHEYGHIYLGHLDGIHEYLDTQICNVFRDHRGELIDRINKECGIDFAEKLIERVIDDPVMNHSLHNIAMDMEVNSKVLSKDDVEEMEADITKVIDNYQRTELEKQEAATSDEATKQEIRDAINKMGNEVKIKLILPCRYHLSDGTPFEDELTYAEYIMFIIEHLDQFIKMMVSIKNGGNGDTSNVTSDDVKKALEDSGGQGKDGQQGQGSTSGDSGMQSLDNLMESMGMSDGSSKTGGGKGSNEKTKSPYSGKRDDSKLNSGDGQDGGSHKDHSNPTRKDADKKRELGEIRSGASTGCGSSGGPDSTRLVLKDVDEVDTAIDEVILNLKNRVVKCRMIKDTMWNYNRGINRKVIAPSIKSKVTINTDPKLVFLIDISGSMDTVLIDRILKTIAKKMRHLGTGRGLKYDIITWSTYLGEHIKDIDPKRPITRINSGGGTSMAGGMKYFRENYDTSATLILISDFEDYLKEWHEQELKMPKYEMYGFNYGYRNPDQKFTYFKVRNFNKEKRNGSSW
jgi:hypothetical protein